MYLLDIWLIVDTEHTDWVITWQDPIDTDRCCNNPCSHRFHPLAL
jgi:hypothetical protein